MNALLDVMRTMRLTGGVFLDCEFTAPWCVTASSVGPDEVGLVMSSVPAYVIAYHYIVEGSIHLGSRASSRFTSKPARSSFFRAMKGMYLAAISTSRRSARRGLSRLPKMATWRESCTAAAAR